MARTRKLRRRFFTDIAGFTTVVEAAAPKVLGALLNEYVGGMTDIVFAHEGTVAKIIGDAIQIQRAFNDICFQCSAGKS
jgi:class 3 adenylate cyclase